MLRHEHEIEKLKPTRHATTQIPHAAACCSLKTELKLFMSRYNLAMPQHTIFWILYDAVNVVHATAQSSIFSFLARLVPFLLLTQISPTR